MSTRQAAPASLPERRRLPRINLAAVVRYANPEAALGPLVAQAVVELQAEGVVAVEIGGQVGFQAKLVKAGAGG